jgi:RNA polymerase sigma-70 factor (ECF subfamily)
LPTVTPLPDATIADPAELELVRRLRAGDEAAFRELVQTYSPAMLRVAQGYVRTRSVAEEVVQEAWLGVVKGLERFEGRSTLKTWIFRIVANTAKTRAERESRTVPFSDLEAQPYRDEPAVEPERFLPDDAPRYPGHWTSHPGRWHLPEDRVVSGELRERIRAAVDELPAVQRTVISLRDIEGWSSDEVCELLGVSEVNQRVLLHRARSKVRAALDSYFEGKG